MGNEKGKTKKDVFYVFINVSSFFVRLLQDDNIKKNVMQVREHIGLT